MRQKLYLIVVGFTAILFLDSCKAPIEPEVRHTGALSKMMSGDLQASISLDSLSQKKNLYAIGAMENLRGEVQIFDSEPFNSVVDTKEIVLDKTFEKKAALLVYAQVPNWQNIEIPAEIDSSTKLEEFIIQKAKDNAIDLAKPFPFLIEGEIESLEWHVIDWPENDTVHNHQKHKEAGANGKLNTSLVDVLGFYSAKHKGVFTHHSTNMHMHFKTQDGFLAGHVDNLILGNKMILKLPRQ